MIIFWHVNDFPLMQITVLDKNTTRQSQNKGLFTVNLRCGKDPEIQKGKFITIKTLRAFQADVGGGTRSFQCVLRELSAVKHTQEV